MSAPIELREVPVRSGQLTLYGDLIVPPAARGVVLFAHGSGSSRYSPRNRHVARLLRDAGFGTLLLDLLTSDEEQIDEVTRELRFDVPMLAERLLDAISWLVRSSHVAGLHLGLFGSSTGAAAALVAAADRPGGVDAVVSRGGRPDLAGSRLHAVRAPTLFVVGGQDLDVLELNRRALEQLGTPARELAVVPGATHLFEEPGALDEVADHAARWFRRHLRPPAELASAGGAP